MSYNPKVTVCVSTYNQESYIEDCLNSLIQQDFSNSFNILIGDDCSTDSTQMILKKYEKEYTFISVIYRSKNIGPMNNFIDIHSRAKGDYICHVDGDDLVYKSKLQIQSDLLDKRSDISLVAHPVKVMNSDIILGESTEYPQVGNIRDLLKYGTYFANSSVMYRKKDRQVYEKNEPIIDYYRFIELTQFGDIYLLKKVLGEYRVHEHGISKNNKYFDLIQKCYDDAFELAINIGCEKELVLEGKFQRKIKMSISALLNNDYLKFKSLIQGAERQNKICFNYFLLKLFSHSELLMKVALLIYKKLK